MACPYFYPVEACEGSATLPLGGWWKGVCHAVPGAPDAGAAPVGGSCDIHCNLGYARGICPRFPDDAGPDAVRFTIANRESAAIRIGYAIERDHHPFAHGRLEYSPAADGFLTPPESALLARQAQAYLENCLRRMEEA